MFGQWLFFVLLLEFLCEQESTVPYLICSICYSPAEIQNGVFNMLQLALGMHEKTEYRHVSY